MATALSPRPDEIRATLDALGERREELTRREMELTGDIAKALRVAEGVIPKAESARRLGLHRTTIYRVYGPS